MRRKYLARPGALTPWGPSRPPTPSDLRRASTSAWTRASFRQWVSRGCSGTALCGRARGERGRARRPSSDVCARGWARGFATFLGGRAEHTEGGVVGDGANACRCSLCRSRGGGVRPREPQGKEAVDTQAVQRSPGAWGTEQHPPITRSTSAPRLRHAACPGNAAFSEVRRGSRPNALALPLKARSLTQVRVFLALTFRVGFDWSFRADRPSGGGRRGGPRCGELVIALTCGVAKAVVRR